MSVCVVADDKALGDGVNGVLRVLVEKVADREEDTLDVLGHKVVYDGSGVVLRHIVYCKYCVDH